MKDHLYVYVFVIAEAIKHISEYVALALLSNHQS